jgi:hypothetical protein
MKLEAWLFSQMSVNAKAVCIAHSDIANPLPYDWLILILDSQCNFQPVDEQISFLLHPIYRTS